MGFLFGLLTGIFAFVATLAIVVVNALKINLDLADPQPKNIQNGTSQNSVSVRANGHDFSNISETRLRQMIEKIIAETMSLPPLSNGHAVSEIALDSPSRRTSDNRTLANNGYYQRHRTEHYFEPTIYQDLLATAVLNKIVGKKLNSAQDIPETNINVGDCDDDVNDNIRLVSSDQNFNAEKLSTSSGSSVEPRSDCSYPEVDQTHNNNDDKSFELPPNSDRESIMSDYLANHMIPLPDLNAITTESEEDDYNSVTSSAVGDGTWEKNWLFKKKKSALTTSATSSSIGMLVPDPKEDIRAQIGDKTADEVSDLSELGSDSDDSLNSLRSQLEPINDRLINKHLIGGQNSKMILDELIECSSMISNTLPTDTEPLYTDAHNENIIDATSTTEAINDNINQQPSVNEQIGTTTCAVVHEELNSNSLTGSIAEREYKKWYNAVEMPNNPYAPEALKRRISGSQERCIDLPNISPTKDLNPLDLLNKPKLDPDENVKFENDYKRYSRDYYINSSLTTPLTPPVRDVSPTIAEDKREATKTSLLSTEKSNDIDLYKALPAEVIESNSFVMERMPPTSISDDSDTIKAMDSVKDAKADQRKQVVIDQRESEEKVSNLGAKRSVSVGSVTTSSRGSTPMAFKFLQPKRRVLEPNQILTADEEGPQVTSSQLEKPVIEAEVVKALPSVKALARAFLLTTNTTQPEKLWLRKARTLSQGKKRTPSPKRSLDLMRTERIRHEDDLTITSDLSSLETDSSSVGTALPTTSDFISPNNPSAEGNTSPVPVRQGVLKNNIAFFENLKNK